MPNNKLHKIEKMMRNRATNHYAKGLNNHIKGVIDRKSIVENIRSSEKAMTELKAIYWFEKELLIAIPILMTNASSFELADRLTLYTNYLKEHVKKLEQKFPLIHQIVLPNTQTIE